MDIHRTALPALIWILFLTAGSTAQEARFLRGDSNADGSMDISDPVSSLAFLFLGEGEISCADAADSNDDGEVDISDAIHSLAYLFTGGAVIPAPGPGACGTDPTPDGIACAFFGPCPSGPPPEAFRMVDLDIIDPHFYVSFLGCMDVTNGALVGFSVNGELQSSIEGDGDGDGLLDLSPVLVFEPLVQGQPGGGRLEMVLAECTAPAAGTTCARGTPLSGPLDYENRAEGICLGPLAGTTTAIYRPAVEPVDPPCFATITGAEITLVLGGIPIHLRDVRLAATFAGEPASGLTDGLLRGFLTEVEADATIIPASFPVVGGEPLSVLFPGGDPDGPERNCSSHSDLDQGPGGQSGWWFYLAFRAERVPLLER